MTNMWRKVSDDERASELNILKHEKLGALLGTNNSVIMAEENPEVFGISEKLGGSVSAQRIRHRLVDIRQCSSRR